MAAASSRISNVCGSPMSIILSLRPGHIVIDAQLDMLGVLQLMWLLGKGSLVQDSIAEVGTPTTQNLRKAGLINIYLNKAGRIVSENDREWKENDPLQSSILEKKGSQQEKQGSQQEENDSGQREEGSTEFAKTSNECQ